MDPKGEVKKPLNLIIVNRSTINLDKNQISHGRSKNIDTIYNFLKEQVMKGMFEVIYFPTKGQLVNGFTKAFKNYIFVFLSEQLELSYVEVYGLVSVC